MKHKNDILAYTTAIFMANSFAELGKLLDTKEKTVRRYVYENRPQFKSLPKWAQVMPKSKTRLVPSDHIPVVAHNRISLSVPPWEAE
jgi:hypothetical protein